MCGRLFLFIWLSSPAFLAGCSESEEGGDKTHVWTDQTRTLERAETVEYQLKEADDKKRQRIEEYTR